MTQSNLERSGSHQPPFVPPKLSYEEFLERYDGRYAEFVDDVAIEPMSVTQRHDDLTGFLLALLRIFVEERQLGKIHGEPYQMKLTIDGKIKGREPDIFFISNENLSRIGEKFFDGPADLVIEVVSPDSIVRDTQEKFDEYESAGVLEYWIIDPHRRTANFYGFDGEGKYRMLPLSDGRFESRVVDGLWIDTAWFWKDELPNLMAVLRELNLH